MPPERIRRRTEFAPSPTIIATYRGAELSTDEIYPPQIVKRRAPEPPREQPERGVGSANGARGVNINAACAGGRSNERTTAAYFQPTTDKVITARGATQSASGAAADPAGAPVVRRARISFGDEEDGNYLYKKDVYVDEGAAQQSAEAAAASAEEPSKPRTDEDGFELPDFIGDDDDVIKID